MVSFIYLHGFASSPQSKKARALGDRFSALGIPLHAPDLNAGDFSHLTLSRQIAQVEMLFPPEPEPVILIGSSFGGLTAAWLGDRHAQVQKLVLLAPAFGFLQHWLPRLGEAAVQHWQETGLLSVYHYSQERQLPLHYSFVTDAAQYEEAKLQRPVPTLILHGIYDDTIPVTASRDHAAHRPWTTLIELDSDHALVDVEAQIWSEIQSFLKSDFECIS
ncbi:MULTISPECIES: YqiA/YcfP family alpha/beta fold hydrolase [unclassified Leptolyngbya]|uniref:YqiA/YcfP family alpha/beta fold hydrolase n=1 Tax=unclassified Leptolyngbya TaxID=2650499 RepID=UPI001689F376|nr:MULTISPECIES: YqiA/YcfP family alpha/beta fold hydrolase [unclassified Leptolyngbya]MBD1910580.1 esterase [Leptolyngbya sp. FACHB-8]MBD2153951.1 esterase [Leptolyngbya sp. FACHB-16]